MTTHDQGESDRFKPIPYVFCRRVKRFLHTQEHRNCLYCFGEKDEVQSGKHEVFCDFRPDLDPVHLGFPEETDRSDRG